MGIFGKLAFSEGATVGTVLATRFLIAAAVLWLLAGPTCVRAIRALPRRDVLLALGLGAVGYGAPAATYFAALERLDASLLALLVYTFPVMVTVTALALGREQPTRRTAVALGVATAGLVLVLASSAGGALDPLGAGLALASAASYSAYILVSEGIAERLRPVVLATLVCTGAAVTLTTASLATGDLAPGAVTPEGLLWLAAIAVVSTVAAVGLFLAGLRRLGPSAASILSTVEPVVTVALAYLAFSERLAAPQLAGAALVLAAVVAVRAQPRWQEAR
jgi:drug/metabolite transporter (DMT)-like permease